MPTDGVALGRAKARFEFRKSLYNATMHAQWKKTSPMLPPKTRLHMFSVAASSSGAAAPSAAHSAASVPFATASTSTLS